MQPKRNDVRRPMLAAHAAVAALWLLVLATTLLAKGVFVEYYFHDMLFVFDSAWRAGSGQVPHVDYPSPIGQAFYWPFEFLGLLGGQGAKTVLHADLVVAATVAFGAALALPRRLSPFLFLLAAASLIGTAVAAGGPDGRWSFDFLAPYNRWGWPILSLVALIALLPPEREEARGWLVDGITLGIGLGLLAYLKVTYVAGAAGVVAFAVLTRRLGWPTLRAAAATAALLAAAIELRFGNSLAYAGDVLSAIRVAADRPDTDLRLVKLGKTAPVAALYLAAVLGLTWLWRPTRSPALWWRTWRGPLASCLAAILCGLFVAYQNHNGYDPPLYVAAVLICAEHGRRLAAASGVTEAIRPPAPWAEPWRRAALWLGIVLSAASVTVLDLASTVRHALATRGTGLCPIPALAGTPLADFLQTPLGIEEGLTGVPSSKPCGALEPTGADYVVAREVPYYDTTVPILSQALMLLRAEAGPDDRILTFQFSNLFSAATRTRPVRGAFTWWHEGRTYSARTHPDANALLSSATLVLQSTAPGTRNDLGEPLWAIYGRAVQARFTPVARNRNWTLWRRNDTLAAMRAPSTAG